MRLKRECEEDYIKVGESKARIGLQDSYQDYVLSRVVTPLSGLKYRHFKDVLTYIYKNEGQGLLTAKISLLLKKL